MPATDTARRRFIHQTPTTTCEVGEWQKVEPGISERGVDDDPDWKLPWGGRILQQCDVRCERKWAKQKSEPRAINAYIVSVCHGGEMPHQRDNAFAESLLRSRFLVGWSTTAHQNEFTHEADHSYLLLRNIRLVKIINLSIIFKTCSMRQKNTHWYKWNSLSLQDYLFFEVWDRTGLDELMMDLGRH